MQQLSRYPNIKTTLQQAIESYSYAFYLVNHREPSIPIDMTVEELLGSARYWWRVYYERTILN